MNQIEQFIRRFRMNEGTVETFTQGCCYWFAVILFIRFMRSGAQIMYDQRENHFAASIGGRVYDITGDVTDGHDWVLWRNMRQIDELEAKRIVRDCINFTDDTEQNSEE